MEEALASLGQDAQALNTLRVYINNLLTNPAEPKFRTINTANPNFQARVGLHAGGIDFLLACGFYEDGGHLLFHGVVPGEDDVNQVVLQQAVELLQTALSKCPQPATSSVPTAAAPVKASPANPVSALSAEKQDMLRQMNEERKRQQQKEKEERMKLQAQLEADKREREAMRKERAGMHVVQKPVLAKPAPGTAPRTCTFKDAGVDLNRKG